MVIEYFKCFFWRWSYIINIINYMNCLDIISNSQNNCYLKHGAVHIYRYLSIYLSICVCMNRIVNILCVVLHMRNVTIFHSCNGHTTHWYSDYAGFKNLTGSSSSFSILQNSWYKNCITYSFNVLKSLVVKTSGPEVPFLGRFQIMISIAFKLFSRSQVLYFILKPN